MRLAEVPPPEGCKLSCPNFPLPPAFKTWKIRGNSWLLRSLCRSGQEQCSQWAICFPLFLFPDWISRGKAKCRQGERQHLGPAPQGTVLQGWGVRVHPARQGHEAPCSAQKITWSLSPTCFLHQKAR